MGKAVKGKRGFVSEGQDIGSEVQAIGVKFPQRIDAALRKLVSNRSRYIREATIKQMKADGIYPKDSV